MLQGNRKIFRAGIKENSHENISSSLVVLVCSKIIVELKNVHKDEMNRELFSLNKHFHLSMKQIP